MYHRNPPLFAMMENTREGEEMYQGTTPALVLRVKNKDLTEATIFASIRTGTNVVTKTGEDLLVVIDDEDTLVTMKLTQNETLKMNAGDAMVQIRYIEADGNAWATTKAKVTVNDVIYKNMIEYEEGGE